MRSGWTRRRHRRSRSSRAGCSRSHLRLGGGPRVVAAAVERDEDEIPHRISAYPCRMDRPNVLLIVLDTARADALEPYGAAAGTTPALAQLAAAGSALPDVHATACWTMPSHASMFTGALPRAVGLSQRAGRDADRLPARARRPAADRSSRRCCGANGYRTRGVSSNIWVAERERLRHRLRRLARRRRRTGPPRWSPASSGRGRAGRSTRSGRAATTAPRPRGRCCADWFAEARRPARVLVREPDRVPLAVPAAEAVQRPRAARPAARRRRRRAAT